MSTDFFQRVKTRAVWIFDGGMGSQLQARGLPVGGCPEGFILAHPELVADIHRAYVQAGSDMIQTNTFGGNAVRLSHYGLADRTEEINERALELARSAAGEATLVVGSVGPLGELLEPYGDISQETARQAFQQQARGLAGADFINIETMSSLEEATLALEAVRSIVDVPISVSMTFNLTERGIFNMMGESARQCAQVLSGLAISMVGSNCGEGVEQMVAIMTEMAQTTELPLLAKPNAGIPSLENGQQVYPETPESFAAKMETLMGSTATVCGGCCGTTPDHIRALRARADAINADRRSV